MEFGVIPIRFIIKSRRLNFLKYILSEPSDSLVYKVLEAQLKHPTRNDWGQSVMKDLKDIDLDMENFKEMSKHKLRRHIKNKIEAISYNYLDAKKIKHKKVKKTSSCWFKDGRIS